MKILIIGDGNSSYIIEQAKWLKKSTVISKVDLFTFELIKEENENGIYDTIISVSNRINFPLLNYFNEQERNIIIGYKQLDTFLSIEEYYDIIQIHFIDIRLVNFVNFFRQKGKKIVASIWGSDLLRSELLEDKMRNLIYDSSDIITMTKTDLMVEKFLLKYPGNNNNKIQYIRYGSDIFNNLIELKLKYSKEQTKELIRIGNDKIIITVGYNSWESQRHIEIMKELLKTKEFFHFLDKIVFFFPLTYGSSSLYKEQLNRFLEDNNIPYITFEKYLTKEQVSLIRYSSDIFIHLSETDDFCSSFREYLFSQNIVITGKWFPYEELVKNGFFFHTIKSIDMLGNELVEVLKSYDQEKANTCINDEKLLMYSDWDTIINEWISLYKDLLLN